jgi:hypothetical protein
MLGKGIPVRSGACTNGMASTSLSGRLCIVEIDSQGDLADGMMDKSMCFDHSQGNARVNLHRLPRLVRHKMRVKDTKIVLDKVPRNLWQKMVLRKLPRGATNAPKPGNSLAMMGVPLPRLESRRRPVTTPVCQRLLPHGATASR